MYTHLSYAELPLCMYADHSNHGHLQPLIERLKRSVSCILKIVGTEIHTLLVKCSNCPLFKSSTNLKAVKSIN